MDTTSVHAVFDSVRNIGPVSRQRGRSGRPVVRLMVAPALILLAGVGLHLYGEAVALSDAGASWSRIGEALQRSAWLGALWCLASFVVLTGVLILDRHAVKSDDRASTARSAPDAREAGEEGAGGGGPVDPLSPAVRRILTLAATRVTVDRDEWAWLEVEREAMRLLAAMGRPGADGPRRRGADDPGSGTKLGGDAEETGS